MVWWPPVSEIAVAAGIAECILLAAGIPELTASWHLSMMSYPDRCLQAPRASDVTGITTLICVSPNQKFLRYIFVTELNQKWERRLLYIDMARYIRRHVIIFN